MGKNEERACSEKRVERENMGFRTRQRVGGGKRGQTCSARAHSLTADNHLRARSRAHKKLGASEETWRATYDTRERKDTGSHWFKTHAIGAGPRPGRRRVHWTECAKIAYHCLRDTVPSQCTRSPSFSCILILHRLVASRLIWNRISGLPACKKLLCEVFLGM